VEITRVLKGYAWAVIGPSLGIYLLIHGGELLGACVFTGIGLLCLSVVIDRHTTTPPDWLWKAGLVSGGIGLLALAMIVIRGIQEQP
jgi:hypothetical protein